MRKLKRLIIATAKKHHALMSLIRKVRFIINRIKSLYFCLNKIDDKLIIFESYMGRQYSDSPKSIYLELLKYHKYKFVWVFKDPDKHDIKEGIKVKYGSKNYYKYYERAKYWISNSRVNDAIIKRKKQIYIQCWHGTPLKRLGYDIKKTDNAMNTLKDIRKKYSADSKRYNYMISPSSYCTNIFKSAFHLKDNVNIIETGYPRNDSLFKYKNIEIKKIKKKFKIPTSKKVILYAPTWRDNQHTSGVGYTYTLGIDLDVLKKYLSQDYVILFRTHYFVNNVIGFEKYKNFIIDVSKYEDINDLYIISDILITDYSSVMFDFANLKKPIIYYMYDYDEYKNNIRDFYFDLNELPGPIIKKENTKKLCEIIQKYNFDKYKVKYIKFNKKFNYLDSESSSKKVVKECILDGESKTYY